MESTPNRDIKSFPGQNNEESLRQFQTPKEEKLNIGQEADRFKKAQENVVNERMFKLFVRAITEKETTGSNDALAFLQNRIIQECVNLSEKETYLIVEQFDREIRNWFSKQYSPSTVDSRVYHRITRGMHASGEGRNDIHIEKGVQSVISFLKARSKLLSVSPAQQYSFYFNSKLDSRYSIDIIEEMEEGSEPTISLIQLKSTEPSEEEKEQTYKDHKYWVKKEWLDFKDYEASYIEEGTELEIKEFISNKEKVEEVLLEFCTNPEGQDLQKFIDSLHLSNLNNKQQAWILYKYIDLLKEQFSEAVKDGALDMKTQEFYTRELEGLKERLVKKVNLPKSVVLIKKIKSVIAVGPKTVFEKEIVVEEGKVMNVR